MRELSVLLVCAALGGATLLSSGAHYDLAAHTMRIHHNASAEVLKDRATQQAVLDQALERPDLPPGMAVVMPGSRRG